MRWAASILCGLSSAAVSVAGAHAAEERFVEVRTAVFAGASGTEYQLVERARLTFESQLADRLTLVGTIEAALHQGRDLTTELRRTLESSDLAPLLELADCTWPEHRNPGLGISSSSGYLFVDRLYADYYGTGFDVRAGRQAVHWGSAQFFNPTDPFPEVLLAEPWRPRQGVNAVTLNVPFGDLHDLTLMGAVDDTLQYGRAAGRVRVNWLETDWALVGAYRGETEEGLVGIDIKGTLVLGFWIEAALKIGDRVYEELAVGLDYSFPVFESLVVMAQYYRNGSGSSGGRPSPAGLTRTFGTVAGPDCADEALGGLFADDEPRDPFAPVTSGTDYLMVSVQAAFLPEISGAVVALQNLHDGTGLLVPTVLTHPTGWLDVGLSAQVPVAVWGEGGEFKPRPQDLSLAVPTGDTIARVDFSGLVPAATVTLWMRGSF